MRSTGWPRSKTLVLGTLIAAVCFGATRAARADGPAVDPSAPSDGAARPEAPAAGDAPAVYAFTIGIAPIGLLSLADAGAGTVGTAGSGAIGGLASLGTLNAGSSLSSPAIVASAERKMAAHHWLGLTLVTRYASSTSDATSGSDKQASEGESQQTAGAAALVWRFLFNPEHRVEVSTFTQLAYERSTAATRSSTGAQSATAKSTLQGVSAGFGLCLDAHINGSMGLRLATQLIDVGRTTQTSHSESSTGPASDSEATSLRAQVRFVPSLGFRVRF